MTEQSRKAFEAWVLDVYEITLHRDKYGTYGNFQQEWIGWQARGEYEASKGGDNAGSWLIDSSEAIKTYASKLAQEKEYLIARYIDTFQCSIDEIQIIHKENADGYTMWINHKPKAAQPTEPAQQSVKAASEVVERVQKLWHEKSFGWDVEKGFMFFGGWGEAGCFSVTADQFQGKAKAIFLRVLKEMGTIDAAIAALTPQPTAIEPAQPLHFDGKDTVVTSTGIYKAEPAQQDVVTLFNRIDYVVNAPEDTFSRAEAIATLNWCKAAIQAQGWQDISTAPKDGTEIIILNCSGRVFRGKCSPETDEEIEWWEEFNSLNVYYEPTHWMPLPTPPQAEVI